VSDMGHDSVALQSAVEHPPCSQCVLWRLISRVFGDTLKVQIAHVCVSNEMQNDFSCFTPKPIASNGER